MKKVFILLLITLHPIFPQNIVSDTIIHEVERKETLFSISQKYKVNINDILELNPKLRESRLKRKSKILITGSQGFIGKILVNRLKNNNQLILIDKKKNLSNQKNFHQINLHNLNDLEKIFKFFGV